MTPEEIRKNIIIQTAIEPPSKEKQSEQPVDTHKIGTVELGELPRTSSLSSNAAAIVGSVGTAITSNLVQGAIADITKEDTSAHTLATTDGLGSRFAKYLKRDLDPKLWKSNAGYWATLIGGIVLTNHVVKKMEQRNFANKQIPNVDQLKQLFDSDLADTHNHQSKENWQEKSQKSDSESRSI